MTEPASHAATLPPASPNGDAPPAPAAHAGHTRASGAHAPPRVAAAAGSARPAPR